MLALERWNKSFWFKSCIAIDWARKRKKTITKNQQRLDTPRIFWRVHVKTISSAGKKGDSPFWQEGSLCVMIVTRMSAHLQPRMDFLHFKYTEGHKFCNFIQITLSDTKFSWNVIKLRYSSQQAFYKGTTVLTLKLITNRKRDTG